MRVPVMYVYVCVMSQGLFSRRVGKKRFSFIRLMFESESNFVRLNWLILLGDVCVLDAEIVLENRS